MEYISVNFMSNETDKVYPAVVDGIRVTVSIAKLMADFAIRPARYNSISGRIIDIR